MTDSTTQPVRLTHDISRQIGRLTEHLCRAPQQQTAQILGPVLDAEEGILGRLTGLLATGCFSAEKHTAAGSFPPELWLALRRAANDLYDLCLDLDAHADDLRQLAQTPPPVPVPPPHRLSAQQGRR